MLKYPAQIDTSQSLPIAIDNQTPVQGLIFNKLRDAVLSVESELGVKPSATYSTVKARIDNLENIIGNLKIIKLNMDLGGDLENPLVVGIQGRPISTVPPQQGDAYVWNGIAWAPLPQSSGGGIGNITIQTISATGSAIIANNTLISITAVTPITITLSGTPTPGNIMYFKDTNGNSGSNTFTINGNGTNIDGASSFIINSAYGSATIVYTGSQWSKI